MKKVRQERANVGVAYDGDADRIGVVDEKGEILWGDKLMVLFSRDILKTTPGATIISEVKASQILYDDIAKHGGRPIMWKTGHSLIKAKMKEEKAALAGEMSGHMFFADRYFGYDDAIYASCRLIEILAKAGQPLSALLADLPKTIATPEIRVDCPDDIKFHVVEKARTELARQHKTIDIDGVRVLFPEGWGLIRASNTQPALVLRFEATSEAALERIRNVVEAQVKKHVPKDSSAVQGRELQNCSGKHAGMVLATELAGWDRTQYVEATEPLQQRVLQAVLKGTDAPEVRVGVDGCGLPVHGMALSRMATLFARLADPDRWEALGPSVRRAMSAMTTEPYLVAGRNRVDTAVMEVAERQTFSGRSVLKLLHTARSNNFVSVFYPVNNRVESLLDEDGIYSQRLMFNRREGRRKNDIEILFDQIQHRAIVTKDGNTETLEVPARVQDTLSVLYFFRTLPGTALQTSTTVDVHHDKKNYRLELRVEGTERMKTPLGEVDTVRILAIMPFKGLFMNEGNIRIWVTNDAARIPVFMKAKVMIGSVTAALTSVEGATFGRP